MLGLRSDFNPAVAYAENLTETELSDRRNSASPCTIKGLCN